MIGMVLELLQKIVKKQKESSKNIGLIYGCDACGAEDGHILKPTIITIQYSRCGHCGGITGFCPKKKKAYIRFN